MVDAPHERIDTRREVEELTDYINNGWLRSGEFDGPTILWNHLIREASQQDEQNRNDAPVAPLTDADTVIGMPMQWYFDSIAAIVPTTERTENGVEMPRSDMPTFHLDSQALSGVDAVVGNALVSTRWADAVANLAKALEMTARFVGNVADRDNEGFDYLKDLVQSVRVYMDAVACNADPMTGEQALRTITRVACNDEFRLNAMQMVELLSCGLSFAQWDDTRMFAYDALTTATASMDELIKHASGNEANEANEANKANEMGEEVDEPHKSLSADDLANLASLDPTLLTERELAESARHQFDHAIQFLRHDLMRISGDATAADRFLCEHHTVEPLADAYAARLVAAERWADLIDFVDLVEHDNPNQCTVMFPEDIVPYEWETMREAALEALGRRDELIAMYHERLDDEFDPNTDITRYKLNLWRERRD